MSWIVKKPVRSHRCSKPIALFCVLNGIGAGSIWRCDECSEHWMLIRDRNNFLRWRKF